MPYQWTSPDTNDDQPVRLRLWPHRSLSARGFVWFIGGTAALISLPLFGLLGTPVLWGLLPFLALAVAGMWWALSHNTRDGDLVEDLTLTRDTTTLVRRNPRDETQEWSANTHWVRVVLHEDGGPVEKYLTLRGGDREVEIGAFLTPEERVALRGELMTELVRLR